MKPRFTYLIALVAVIGLPLFAYAQTRDAIMPTPRAISLTEQQELARLVYTRSQQSIPRDAQYLAAGPFRFVDNRYFRYFDRSDLGSVALEFPQYGVSDKALDPLAIDPKVIVPRALQALQKSGLDTSQLSFARFFDEFAGAAEPALLPRDFDPRKASMHVARSLMFERRISGVPVFGSEVLVGLLPDGAIGRLRYHAPKVDDLMVREAMVLRDAVAKGGWTVPESLRSPDTKVLEVQGGVGHSSFASPQFRAAPVVRVVYRRANVDAKPATQTTAYAYFDAAGREVVLDRFPQLAGTPSTSKKQ